MKWCKRSGGLVNKTLASANSPFAFYPRIIIYSRVKRQLFAPNKMAWAQPVERVTCYYRSSVCIILRINYCYATFKLSSCRSFSNYIITNIVFLYYNFQYNFDFKMYSNKLSTENLKTCICQPWFLEWFLETRFNIFTAYIIKYNTYIICYLLNRTTFCLC